MTKYIRPVSHPGLLVKDAIEELGLSQSEFAFRTGMTIKNVSTLVNGESNITFEVALKLADYFGNSVEGWINLQTKFDIWKNEERRAKEYEADWQIAKMFDVKFLKEYLQIQLDKNDKESAIDKMRKCFNVNLLQNLKQPDMYAFYKTSAIKEVDEKTIIMRNAWISIAEQKARDLTCAEFNKEKIVKGTKYLKSLTKLDPKEFDKKLREFLLDAGVKLVILPYLSGSNVSGVTKWIGNQNCVMVAINDCGKDADRIWFTIFHELGHAIKNHRRHLTISYEKDQILDREEIEANEFAKNSLIDKDNYREFVAKGQFDLKSIQEFANKQNVADFIIIGRLQKEGIIGWNKYQEQKIKYTIK